MYARFVSNRLLFVGDRFYKDCFGEVVSNSKSTWCVVSLSRTTTNNNQRQDQVNTKLREEDVVRCVVL